MAEARPGPDGALPPSVLAAQQAAARAGRQRKRAYPLGASADDPKALVAQLAATQALLRAESEVEVSDVVSTLVHDLGGALVPARFGEPATALAVDVSLGVGEPMLPSADPVSVAAMRISAVVPEFLETARLVLARLQGEARRDDEATRDPLTGVLTRRAWMRRLSLAEPGDGICLVDLDHFKAVNDTAGHAAGDAVLRAMGELLLRTFRKGDSCGRYGGDEFVCLAPGLSGDVLMAKCDRLRQTWLREHPQHGAPGGLSIGVAEVGEEGGRAALLAADAAMYRGKTAGGNVTVLSSTDDDGLGRSA
ncbi:MAG: GGDEF domain-containing protein [Propionibacteriales bacterium]|nr:GGDEF domain-containing protein [Propionibacteriales bacterium]